MNVIRRPLHCVAQVLCLLLSFTLPAAAAEVLEVLEVQAPWIRVAPPTAPVLAGYVTLVNRSDAALMLVGASSDAFGAIEVHEMRDDGGVMRMRAVPQLVLPVGEAVALAPGGLHLMLMRPLRALAVGDEVEIGFELSDGTRVPVVFEVCANAAD